ncbi:hypothetical protein [Methanosarcina barkeri]|uniref:7,8 dihydropteroate synthase (Methanopterin) n=1 Tax=Methanosarcina barkeri 227 TaxID=1434106 RepID=A0A0E3LQ38_METBA|nr:hypothetical protein [Methanosarcina barkeri]AKB57596.1 7,8 dihydropteroate synthase (methanopterin) [Methanosarcina barkeri 227]
MRKIKPDYVVPMHCTGWKAINRFAEAMPEKFLLIRLAQLMYSMKINRIP